MLVFHTSHPECHVHCERYCDPICKPSTSDGVSWLVTSDLAESPILFEQEFLCTTAMEYNRDTSKGKMTASVRFIIKIHTILSFHICGCWQIKSYLRKFHYLKKGVCEKSTPNRPNYGRDILLGNWLQSCPFTSCNFGGMNYACAFSDCWERLTNT